MVCEASYTTASQCEWIVRWPSHSYCNFYVDHLGVRHLVYMHCHATLLWDGSGFLRSILDICTFPCFTRVWNTCHSWIACCSHRSMFPLRIEFPGRGVLCYILHGVQQLSCCGPMHNCNRVGYPNMKMCKDVEIPNLPPYIPPISVCCSHW